MAERGVDYSWARPGGQAIREAGFTFAMRYCPYPGDGGKGLTRGELDDLHANGVAVGLVFESTANRALGGRIAGLRDGSAVVEACEQLGWPDYEPVYFAVDFDATEEQQPAIDEYLRGAAVPLGLPLVGVYGGYHVVKRCWENGTAKWLWQTYAWSGGLVHPEVHVYQYLNGQTLNGAAVDYNEARKADFGQWRPDAAQEGDVTRQEYEDLILALFAGAEERDSTGQTATRAGRLAAARYRIDSRANGEDRSLLEIAASREAVVPEHRHDLAVELSQTGGVKR